jgi:hypothetical protein
MARFLQGRDGLGSVQSAERRDRSVPWHDKRGRRARRHAVRNNGGHQGREGREVQLELGDRVESTYGLQESRERPETSLGSLGRKGYPSTYDHCHLCYGVGKEEEK